MAEHNETFRNIILNDKEIKLYDFEKNFLNNYFKNNLIDQLREKISFNYSTKNAVNIVLQAA